ncbi:MAG TPA: AI-2E family transporter, partial [Thermoanaerobaculia bacterium]|nr:AI-2E family transporter [Thermoanaerobaculia bacterium]
MAFSPRDAERHGELELFIKKVAIVVAIGILLALLWVVRDILVLVFIAAVLAAGIAPAVHRVRVLGRYYLHRNIARGTAVMTVYLPFLIGGLLLVAFLAPRMIAETQALGEQLPQLLEKNVLTPLERFIPMAGVRDYLGKGVSVSTSSVLLYVKNAVTIVASVVAVLFMIVYMLIDAHRLRNLILLLYPAEVRAERRRTMSRMANRMTSWLSGQLILSAIMGVAT